MCLLLLMSSWNAFATSHELLECFYYFSLVIGMFFTTSHELLECFYYFS